MGEFQTQFAGLRAAVQAQKAIPQRPRERVMGAAEKSRVTTESLLDAAAIPNVSAYQVRGIDISHYQGAIDWSKVSADGLSFVYMKATEGADGVDERFADNWKGAARTGLKRGAYHFYNFCKGGSVQAAQFIKTVPADADALPPTIDLEESADCGKMPSKAAFRKDLAAFVAKVKAAYGHSPIMYVNNSIYDLYFKGENDSYRLWVADIKHEAPVFPDDSSWTMWQYAWHGQAAGIGEVDLDVFNGTPEMLAALPLDNSVMVASLGPR
jgi:lysozyme